MIRGGIYSVINSDTMAAQTIGSSVMLPRKSVAIRQQQQTSVHRMAFGSSFVKGSSGKQLAGQQLEVQAASRMQSSRKVTTMAAKGETRNP